MSESSVVWAAALGLSIVGSIGGLLVASVLLLCGPAVRARVVPSLVSYAVGVVGRGRARADAAGAGLAASPARVRDAACRHTDVLHPRKTGAAAPLPRRCGVQGAQSTVTLVIVGDAVHTFVDGVAIAATTLVSIPLGVSTALAAIAHEIPQEAGDFAILLSAGRSRKQALMLNATSAIGGLIGALAMLMLGSAMPTVAPCARVRGRQLSLRRHGRPDSALAPRRNRHQQRAPGQSHRTRTADHLAVGSISNSRNAQSVHGRPPVSHRALAATALPPPLTPPRVLLAARLDFRWTVTAVRLRGAAVDGSRPPPPPSILTVASILTGSNVADLEDPQLFPQSHPLHLGRAMDFGAVTSRLLLKGAFRRSSTTSKPTSGRTSSAFRTWLPDAFFP